MKKFILILFAILTCQTHFGQAPNKMSYQAVVRDGDNNLISNQAVGLKVSILTDSASGTAVYEETHTINSNLNGLVSLIIGEGTNQVGSFLDIDWSGNTHFMKTDIDVTGGSNYSISGVQQVLSVPYAIHARTADNLGGIEGNEVGEMLYWDGNGWVSVQDGVHGQVLTYCDGVPTWGFCMRTSVPGPITSQTARLRGEISTDGGLAITERGICFSTSPDPTTADFTRVTGSGIGAWNNTLGNLTTNTTYYAKAYGINALGTTYGNEVSFTTTNEIGIGDIYPEEGGAIFYILQPSDPGYDPAVLHGLIVSPIIIDTGSSDVGATWGCIGTMLGGTSTDMFTGQSNSNSIVNNCSETNIPAKFCIDHTYDGFDDWYLGSRDEMLELYLAKAAVNANLIENVNFETINNTFYWTSSEFNSTKAWYISMSTGFGSTGSTKNASLRSRPIRTF